MSIWTEDRVERVKELWQSGLSSGAIASTIGGCSRNAVIGLVHRRGWQRSESAPTESLITLRAGATRFWTRDKDETLRKAHGQRLTMREIGERLGCSFVEASRRCKALGLKPARAPSGRGASRGRKYGNGGGLGYKLATGTFGKKSKATTVRAEPPKPPMCNPVTLMDAEFRHCRFVIGNPNGPDTTFCGAQREIGSSFCSWHRQIAYHAPERRNIESLARVV